MGRCPNCRCKYWPPYCGVQCQNPLCPPNTIVSRCENLERLKLVRELPEELVVRIIKRLLNNQGIHSELARQGFTLKDFPVAFYDHSNRMQDSLAGRNCGEHSFSYKKAIEVREDLLELGRKMGVLQTTTTGSKTISLNVLHGALNLICSWGIQPPDGWEKIFCMWIEGGVKFNWSMERLVLYACMMCGLTEVLQEVADATTAEDKVALVEPLKSRVHIVDSQPYSDGKQKCLRGKAKPSAAAKRLGQELIYGHYISDERLVGNHAGVVLIGDDNCEQGTKFQKKNACTGRVVVTEDVLETVQSSMGATGCQLGVARAKLQLHLFRESNGKLRINSELFGANHMSYAGYCLSEYQHLVQAEVNGAWVFGVAAALRGIAGLEPIHLDAAELLQALAGAAATAKQLGAASAGRDGYGCHGQTCVFRTNEENRPPDVTAAKEMHVELYDEGMLDCTREGEVYTIAPYNLRQMCDVVVFTCPCDGADDEGCACDDHPHEEQSDTEACGFQLRCGCIYPPLEHGCEEGYAKGCECVKHTHHRQCRSKGGQLTAMISDPEIHAWRTASGGAEYARAKAEWLKKHLGVYKPGGTGNAGVYTVKIYHKGATNPVEILRDTQEVVAERLETELKILYTLKTDMYSQNKATAAAAEIRVLKDGVGKLDGTFLLKILSPDKSNVKVFRSTDAYKIAWRLSRVQRICALEEDTYSATEDLRDSAKIWVLQVTDDALLMSKRTERVERWCSQEEQSGADADLKASQDSQEDQEEQRGPSSSAASDATASTVAATVSSGASSGEGMRGSTEHVSAIYDRSQQNQREQTQHHMHQQERGVPFSFAGAASLSTAFMAGVRGFAEASSGQEQQRGLSGSHAVAASSPVVSNAWGIRTSTDMSGRTEGRLPLVQGSAAPVSVSHHQHQQQMYPQAQRPSFPEAAPPSFTYAAASASSSESSGGSSSKGARSSSNASGGSGGLERIRQQQQRQWQQQTRNQHQEHQQGRQQQRGPPATAAVSLPPGSNTAPVVSSGWGIRTSNDSSGRTGGSLLAVQGSAAPVTFAPHHQHQQRRYPQAPYNAVGHKLCGAEKRYVCINASVVLSRGGKTTAGAYKWREAKHTSQSCETRGSRVIMSSSFVYSPLHKNASVDVDRSLAHA